MTVDDILEQAKALTHDERKELTKRLIDTLDTPQDMPKPATGAEIVAMLRARDDAIDVLVDPHIEDPVEWVKAQHQKEQDRLKPYWDGDV